MKRSILAIAFATLSSMAFAEGAPAGSADAGKAMFQKAGCWTCHNYGGTGSAGTGPRIGPTALEWEGFIHQVREPANQMAPFPEAILSDQDLANIYAYLQTQKREDPKTIPLLSK